METSGGGPCPHNTACVSYKLCQQPLALTPLALVASVFGVSEVRRVLQTRPGYLPRDEAPPYGLQSYPSPPASHTMLLQRARTPVITSPQQSFQQQSFQQQNLMPTSTVGWPVT